MVILELVLVLSLCFLSVLLHFLPIVLLKLLFHDDDFFGFLVLLPHFVGPAPKSFEFLFLEFQVLLDLLFLFLLQQLGGQLCYHALVPVPGLELVF